MTTMYCELLVVFERDMAEAAFTYLGQACWMGHVAALLEGYRCKRPWDFCPERHNPMSRILFDAVLRDSKSLVESGETDPLERCVADVLDPYWADANDGWKMAQAIRHALDSDRVKTAGVEAIVPQLEPEVEHLVELLTEAVGRNIRFHVTVREMKHPPADLVEWVESDLEELADDIRNILEEHGVEIRDDQPEE